MRAISIFGCIIAVIMIGMMIYYGTSHYSSERSKLYFEQNLHNYCVWQGKCQIQKYRQYNSPQEIFDKDVQKCVDQTMDQYKKYALVTECMELAKTLDAVDLYCQNELYQKVGENACGTRMNVYEKDLERCRKDNGYGEYELSLMKCVCKNKRKYNGYLDALIDDWCE